MLTPNWVTTRTDGFAGFQEREKIMRNGIFGLSLAAAVLAGAAGSVQAEEVRERGWMPMSTLISRLEAAGYRNIEEIEREHGRYEVRVTDRDGRRRKLYLDARTGEALHRQPGEYGPPPRVQPAADGRECNRRRCRDDMPARLPGGGR